eukprot:s1551_g12.t2
MVRTFLQTRDIQREPPDKGKGKEGKVRYEAARASLQEMGYTAFPHKDPECAGSFQDLNEHRISMAVTQALQSGLAVVEAATTATAHALMQTFLSSRRGPNDEDLMELLSFPTEQGEGWFRIMPSNDKVAGMRHFDNRQGVAGMRHFDNRQGVYLHKPSNKHLAQGYAAFIRYGPKHAYLRALCEVEVDPAGSVKKGKKTNQLIFEYDSVRICAFHLQVLRALCEVEVDPAGSVKKGKKTNQLIFEYDSVRICAFHLQVATKSELKHGDYLREWAGALEVPLSSALQAFQAMGLGLGPDGAAGGPLPSSTSIIPGGEQGRSGKGRKGSEGRRHVHLISVEDRGQDVMSGFRENATMVIAVDARHTMRQGVTFYRSKNGVVLTSDRIPSASILHYESLRDHQKHDRRGNPM